MFCYYFTLLSKNIERKVNEFVEQRYYQSILKKLRIRLVLFSLLVSFSNNHSCFHYIIIYKIYNIQDINIFVKSLSNVNFKTQIKKQTQNLINKDLFNKQFSL